MGLDMYLYQKVHIGSEDVDVKVFKDGKQVFLPNNPKILTYEFGYWRKANQIHNWFVDYVKSGLDDCKEYEVSIEKLLELKVICQRVIDNSILEPGKILVSTKYSQGEVIEEYKDGFAIKNPSLAESDLPTSSGFFFGSTSYDEYYLNTLRYTIELIDKAIKDTRELEESGLYSEFYYWACW